MAALAFNGLSKEKKHWSKVIWKFIGILSGILSANQLTGFYMLGTLVAKELKSQGWFIFSKFSVQCNDIY